MYSLSCVLQVRKFAFADVFVRRTIRAAQTTQTFELMIILALRMLMVCLAGNPEKHIFLGDRIFISCIVLICFLQIITLHMIIHEAWPQMV